MKITNSLLTSDALATPDDRYVRALAALYEVMDPELGINIVDLGLIYHLDIADEAAVVTMTMTTPACPLSAYLEAQVVEAVQAALPELRTARVVLTFDPLWDPELMSHAAKQALGW